MAVVDYSVGDGVRLPVTESGELFTLKKRLDTSVTGVTAANVAKLWVIPANTMVLDVMAIVRTAEGGTLTIDVGDYLVATDAEVDADGYLDGINGNSAAVNRSLSTDIGYGGGGGANTYGKVYTANTAYIGALFNNTADTAVVDFIALCMDIGDNKEVNTY